MKDGSAERQLRRAKLFPLAETREFQDLIDQNDDRKGNRHLLGVQGADIQNQKSQALHGPQKGPFSRIRIYKVNAQK